MNDRWSSYGNSYLRHLKCLTKPKDTLTISTQSQQELQQALVQIQIFAERMRSGKAKIGCLMTISLTVVDSEETM